MRLIDADRLYCSCRYAKDCWSDNCNNCSDYVITKKEIDEQPTIERPKGKWLIRNVSFMPYNTAYECSHCGEWGRVQTFKMNYCPNCGAEMEKVRWKNERYRKDKKNNGAVKRIKIARTK